MALSPYCVFQRGTSPIIAAAIHNGHDTRPQVARQLALSDKQQRREEDPFTGEWAQIAKIQIVGLRSRFEVDLNRPREKAVYLTPEDAWGLQVWKATPDADLIEASLQEYDAFYADVRALLRGLVSRHGRIVVYDLHTYNQFREGPTGPPADPQENPEVNVGTGTMDRRFWSPVVDRFLSDLRAYDFQGRALDVRENIKFRGGYFGQWIHENFPRQVCALSIEFKKFFMDEWEGLPDTCEVERIYQALQATLPGVHDALERM